MLGRKRRRKEPIHPVPQGRDTACCCAVSATWPQASEVLSLLGRRVQIPPAPQPGERPLQVPKAVGTKQVSAMLEVLPAPRGYPGLAAWERPWGQEEQGCSWSPGLWVSGEKGLQRGSTSGDTDWCHSPARGHHPFFKVLLDLLPGPPRAPGQEHPPSQQHLGCK